MSAPTGPRDHWNHRFDRPEFVYGEAPNAFLRQQAEGLAPGRALCVADGEGRNGVWLAGLGWQVVAVDFSAVAQRKAAELARRRAVTLTLVEADVHDWDYPEAAFDLVVDIFSQFSAPGQRARKWAGMRRSLAPGGHLIVMGYSPAQLAHGTGGPSQPENLYTPDLLREAFAGLEIVHLEDSEVVLDEGVQHRGRSAIAGLVARRPATLATPAPAASGRAPSRRAPSRRARPDAPRPVLPFSAVRRFGGRAG